MGDLGSGAGAIWWAPTPRGIVGERGPYGLGMAVHDANPALATLPHAADGTCLGVLLLDGGVARACVSRLRRREDDSRSRSMCRKRNLSTRRQQMVLARTFIASGLELSRPRAVVPSQESKSLG